MYLSYLIFLFVNRRRRQFLYVPTKPPPTRAEVLRLMVTIKPISLQTLQPERKQAHPEMSPTTWKHLKLVKDGENGQKESSGEPKSQEHNEVKNNTGTHLVDKLEKNEKRVRFIEVGSEGALDAKGVNIHFQPPVGNSRDLFPSCSIIIVLI